MANEVRICNLALSRLGDDATVASLNPPEGSAQAEHCANFYPLALGSLLEMHEWSFATRTQPLAQLAQAAPAPWIAAYALPGGCIKVIELVPRSGGVPNSAPVPYALEAGADGQRILFTDLHDASIRFIVRVDDAQQYPPLFIDALSWLLASHLAGPIIKGDVGQKMAHDCLRQFMLALSLAKISDANQQRGRPEPMPVWMVGR